MRRSCERTEHVPWELAELRRRMETLPVHWRGDLLPLCNRLTDWSRRQDRLVRAAQEAVNQLQLDIKYLHFDRDATRRERDAFRALLEQD